MVSQNINNQFLALPKDWCYYRFGNVAKVLRGGSPRPIQKYITRDINGVNWIKIGDTNVNDMYINNTCEKIIKSGVKYSRYVYIGDIILSNSMSFGRPYILNINGCIHDGWLVIQDYRETYDTTFLYYALSSNIVKQQYIRLASGSGVKNLNKKTVLNTYIITPPKEEQIKIVNVLKNIDKLIYNLEILIKKKKSIKQGLMHELLTCKKRLCGFIDKWKNIKLNEICDFISGFSFASDDFIKTGIALIKISNINNETVKVDNDTVYLPLDYLKKYEKFLIKYNDLLIAMSGATTGKMGVYKLKRNALLNQRVGIIRAKKGYSQMFLTYILQMYVTTILEMALGGAQPNISANVINKIKIDIPISLNEQKAIASIISNIDNEIMLLNNKLSKYIQIKQGIMEELLTGKKKL